MEPDGFRDRNHRYSYLVACAIARRIAEDPSRLKDGLLHLERFATRTPHLPDGYGLWKDLLRQPAEVIAARLMELTPRGDYIRETAPSFGALPKDLRAELSRRARVPLGTEPKPEPQRMVEKAKRLRKRDIAHLLRAAAGVTGRRAFVMIGTGAVIARLKTVPLDLMSTREIDIYAEGAEDADAIADLIDGTLGEGSPFDATFGYYVHGIGESTACMPSDWRARAVQVTLPNVAGITCLCPDPDDIALSKICAWRDKDKTWLIAGVRTGVLDLAAMASRAALVSNAQAPAAQEIERRIDAVRALVGTGMSG
jgi:hypothetical protein